MLPEQLWLALLQEGRLSDPEAAVARLGAAAQPLAEARLAADPSDVAFLRAFPRRGPVPAQLLALSDAWTAAPPAAVSLAWARALAPPGADIDPLVERLGAAGAAAPTYASALHRLGQLSRPGIAEAVLAALERADLQDPGAVPLLLVAADAQLAAASPLAAAAAATAPPEATDAIAALLSLQPGEHPEAWLALARLHARGPRCAELAARLLTEHPREAVVEGLAAVAEAGGLGCVLKATPRPFGSKDDALLAALAQTLPAQTQAEGAAIPDPEDLQELVLYLADSRTRAAERGLVATLGYLGHWPEDRAIVGIAADALAERGEASLLCRQLAEGTGDDAAVAGALAGQGRLPSSCGPVLAEKVRGAANNTSAEASALAGSALVALAAVRGYDPRPVYWERLDRSVGPFDGHARYYADHPDRRVNAALRSIVEDSTNPGLRLSALTALSDLGDSKTRELAELLMRDSSVDRGTRDQAAALFQEAIQRRSRSFVRGPDQGDALRRYWERQQWKRSRRYRRSKPR